MPSKPTCLLTTGGDAHQVNLFITQQQQGAAWLHKGPMRNTEEPSVLQQSLGVPVLTPGAFCLPSGLLGTLRHLHFSY